MMGIDNFEAKRQGAKGKRKFSTKHPYAAIEHRVIDSPAYADLTYSARSLLVLMTRQLTKDNNGRLQATFSYMRRFGIDSERTLSRAIQDLIAHGMIYRSRSGGYQQGAAQYAVTWLPVRNQEGLFLDGFKPYAWREWTPKEEKTPPAKKQDYHVKNVMRSDSATAKNTGGTPRKNADNELIPCREGFSGYWIKEELARIAHLGLAGRQCFQVPADLVPMHS